ncbi:MAG TPA: hypothetical protein VM030_09135 [Acidimicrobiales bacterium]|nr:hypothetical protein [Acidimicrobiales bacterium]
MAAQDSRPWLVMITGEPGSGKTSLGLLLSTALRVPFLSRDQVRGGSLATAGLWTGRLRQQVPREAAVDAFVEIVEAMARAGVSSVVEFVVTPAREPAFERLEAAARCLVILTTATDAAERAARRDRVDPLLTRPEVLAAIGHRSIDDYLDAPERELVRAQMRTEFDLPLLRVATDDGYAPCMPDIVDWVIARTLA